MTEINPAPEDTLTALLLEYKDAKAEAKHHNNRVKEVSDAIKLELRNRCPNDTKVTVHSQYISTPITLSHETRFVVDTTRLKAEDPITYATYAKKIDIWKLS